MHAYGTGFPIGTVFGRNSEQRKFEFFNRIADELPVRICRLPHNIRPSNRATPIQYQFSILVLCNIIQE